MAVVLTRLASRFPGLTLAALALFTAVVVSGFTNLYSVSYVEGALPEADPERTLYRELQKNFGSDRLAIFVLGCAAGPCETVFDPPVLEVIHAIEEFADADPTVVEVDAITNVRLLRGAGDDTLTTLSLAWPLEAESVAEFRAQLLQDPLAVGTIVSPDLRTAAVAVRFDTYLPDAEINAGGTRVIEEANRLAHAAGFELYPTGDVAFTAVTDSYVRRDVSYMLPGMLLLIALFLYWAFHSVGALLLALATVILPTLWVFGLMGLLGTPLSPVTSSLPILVLVIGVTDAVHFLVRTFDLRHAFAERRDLLLAVGREVGPPTTYTAIVAAIGFLALLSGDVPVIREYGAFAALGVLGAWLLTFTLIPAALMLFPIRIESDRLPAFEIGQAMLNGIRRMAHRHAPVVGVIALFGLGASVYGFAQIRPENDPLKIIGSTDHLFKSIEFIEENLRPTASIELVYEAPEGTSLVEPAQLARLARIEDFLRREGDGATVASILPVLRLARREVADAGLTLPEDRAEAAQLLLLAESASPETLDPLLSGERKVRFSAGYSWESLGGEAIVSELARIRRDLAELAGDGARWYSTGNVFLSAHMGELLLSSQIQSFAWATLGVFCSIWIFIRRFRYAALGLIPNVFPVFVVLGVMGHGGFNLDAGTAMLASIILGVATDDTMYFLTHYKAARERDQDIRDAVAYTFAVAGKPAMFSSVLLASGFFVLGLSNFQSLAIFGFLASLAILLAVVSELFLMPMVLELVARGRGPK